ncbi:probable glutathione S-transferase 7 [Aplysia californica]|uniref:Probable glutathione S-transferase 7 n=1 Tax=Aplysia californica TaxID=6500 RepID=A0ABM0ZV34_APLCA|nr:probable glutathione S-transferase 7 [Aplysia californica]XP_012935067.1 probable glutathione S-transferase 7 [Aplysia californica]
MADSKLKLNYFNVKGRAELSRLVLAAAGKEYEDLRFSREEWPNYKKATPFGQTPTLEVDGKLIAQSTAIAAFLAREFGFHGKTNMESLEIDQWLNLKQDFFSEIRKAVVEKDAEKQAEIWKIFKETVSPRYLQYYEDGLKQNGTGYLVGDRLTLADLVVFDIVTGIVEGKICGLENFPLVKALVDKVGAVERIKSWIETRPVTIS